jgi:hypothetical protein
VIVGHPNAGVAVVDSGVLELDLGQRPSWPLVKESKPAWLLPRGVEKVRGALPCRGRLIGEQSGETLVVAVPDKLGEVGDKVGPRME